MAMDYDVKKYGKLLFNELTYRLKPLKLKVIAKIGPNTFEVHEHLGILANPVIARVSIKGRLLNFDIYLKNIIRIFNEENVGKQIGLSTLINIKNDFMNIVMNASRGSGLDVKSRVY